MITFANVNYLNGNVAADIAGGWVHCTAIESFLAQVEFEPSVPGNGSSLLRWEGTNDPSHVALVELAALTASGGPYLDAFFQTPGILVNPLPEWVRIVWRHDVSDPVQGTLKVRLIGRS